MANKSPLSIPSIGSSSSRTPSPLPKDVTQAIAAAAAVDESSESENETEPARIFQRRVSTSKNLNGSVSEIVHHSTSYDDIPFVQCVSLAKKTEMRREARATHKQKRKQRQRDTNNIIKNNELN